MRSPPSDRRGGRAAPLVWGALGLIVVAVFIAVLWARRPPSPGIADAPSSVAVPQSVPAAPLPDARPVTPP